MADTSSSQPVVLGTGLSGLVGSKIVELFSNKYTFENLDLTHPTRPIDITKFDQVLQASEASPAEVLLHFAAYTDVGKSWEQRDDKNGVAYQVNVVGTENMVKAAAETGKHLVHISTAYVFDGEKEGMYTEEDEMHPIEWYGQTKALAEEVVRKSKGSWTILRIDQPFRADPFAKMDVVHRVIDGLFKGTLPPQFTNHFVGPTFIEDFAQIIDWVITKKPKDLFHATSGEQWTDFDLATVIQETHKLPGKVERGDLENYLKQSTRPYQRNTALSTEKLAKIFPGQRHSIREAIAQVKFASATP
jgi:dTDP-4-dehydrorhamnose reductase